MGKEHAQRTFNQLSELGIKENLQGYVNKILEKEDVVPIDIFQTGHTGNIVLLAQKPDKNLYVVKIPQDEISQAEIFTNLRGFERIREEGIPELLPDVIETGTESGFTYTLATYLGKDFATLCREFPEPTQVYDKLVDLVYPLYSKTRKEDGQSEQFLSMIVLLLRKNFYKHIIPAGLSSESEVGILIDIDTAKLSSPISCFAVFDFTPEDTYLYPETIKYPDPKDRIRGNPIIDLACFAGLSRDVYNLPGSVGGYKKLEDFSTQQVASLLELTESQAQRVFFLGRAVQYSLSSRFRANKDPEKACEFASLSLDFLRLSEQ